MLTQNGETIQVHYLDRSDQVETLEMRVQSNLGTEADFIDAWHNVSLASFLIVMLVEYTSITSSPNPIPPTDPQALNGVKWQVNYQDTVTGGLGRWFIPCADLSLLPAGSEALDITTPGQPGYVFRTWLEARALSADGNTVQVTGIVFAG